MAETSFIGQFEAHTLFPGSDVPRFGTFQTSIDQDGYSVKFDPKNRLEPWKNSMNFQLNLFRSFSKDSEVTLKVNLAIEDRLDKLQTQVNSLVPPGVAPEKLQQEIESKEKQISDLEKEKDQLEDGNKMLKFESEQNEANINDLNEQLINCTTEIVDLKKELTDCISKKNAFEVELTGLNAEKEQKDVFDAKKAVLDTQQRIQKEKTKKELDAVLDGYNKDATERKKNLLEEDKKVEKMINGLLASGYDEDEIKAREGYEKYVKNLGETIKKLEEYKTFVQKLGEGIKNLGDDKTQEKYNELLKNLPSEIQFFTDKKKEIEQKAQEVSIPKDTTNIFKRQGEFVDAWKLFMKDPASLGDIRKDIWKVDQGYYEAIIKIVDFSGKTELLKEGNKFNQFLKQWKDFGEERFKKFTIRDDLIEGKDANILIKKVSDTFDIALKRVFGLSDPFVELSSKKGLSFGSALRTFFLVDLGLERLYQALDKANQVDKDDLSVTWILKKNFTIIESFEKSGGTISTNIYDIEIEETSDDIISDDDLLTELQKEFPDC